MKSRNEYILEPDRSAVTFLIAIVSTSVIHFYVSTDLSFRGSILLFLFAAILLAMFSYAWKRLGRLTINVATGYLEYSGWKKEIGDTRLSMNEIESAEVRSVPKAKWIQINTKRDNKPLKIHASFSNASPYRVVDLINHACGHSDSLPVQDKDISTFGKVVGPIILLSTSAAVLGGTAVFSIQMYEQYLRPPGVAHNAAVHTQYLRLKSIKHTAGRHVLTRYYLYLIGEEKEIVVRIPPHFPSLLITELEHRIGESIEIAWDRDEEVIFLRRLGQNSPDITPETLWSEYDRNGNSRITALISLLIVFSFAGSFFYQTIWRKEDVTLEYWKS